MCGKKKLFSFSIKKEDLDKFEDLIMNITGYNSYIEEHAGDCIDCSTVTAYSVKVNVNEGDKYYYIEVSDYNNSAYYIVTVYEYIDPELIEQVDDWLRYYFGGD